MIYVAFVCMIIGIISFEYYLHKRELAIISRAMGQYQRIDNNPLYLCIVLLIASMVLFYLSGGPK